LLHFVVIQIYLCFSRREETPPLPIVMVQIIRLRVFSIQEFFNPKLKYQSIRLR
jgi:hypothetical protein